MQTMTRKLTLGVMLALSASAAYAKDTIYLDGQHMTIDQAWQIADGKVDVAIAKDAESRLSAAHNTLMKAAASGKPVYGLTVGVGLNKDHKLFDASGKMTKEAIQASRDFQYNALRAHSSAIGDPMDHEMVRLGMVVRLNTLLHGQTGVQPEVADLYVEYLNNDIVPVIPEQGTVGEADILQASHVGLAMIGEWKVDYKGHRVSSKEAMKDAGIKPLKPIGKDALSILSNNAFTTAYVMRGLQQAQQVMDVSPTVFGLSLEALNGNVAPYLPQTNEVRPFPNVQSMSETILDQLDGSYLWQLNDERPLQDPLSFRTSGYTFAIAQKAMDDLTAAVKVQINSSDDNPAVVMNPSKKYLQQPQVAKYMVDENSGVFPTTNFNPLPVVMGVQQLNIALAQVSHNTAMRTLRLSEDHFTHLSRFLTAPGNKGHAFGAIQKTFADLNTRNMMLAQPVSFEGIAIAGNIEDTYTNMRLAADNLIEMTHNLYAMYSVELMHSAQAIDLRRMKNPNLKLGKATGELYNAYRAKVKFVSQDRPYTPDFAAGTKLIEQY
ncbi:HAL/PAL/TAL family ammonia-lyase [Paraferrimonas haliotis]|uniref:Phenylalanine/histidine ammonia-lyase n=1 Tax=Paraferrimonas haliotis TaxID=2013866 RepID=A0AA37WYA0_9GAMM|nr:aromatic amino acid ammonia-lyase [Paraferrimonas haliotis]GLS82881.1 phenylalanine/histidine ammonia-lyase [Paraferrimonas haliotis]